uniref:Uncharacterized protein n=1 Tax=Anguilla anguilla TaxID=7936 RepID=A0A0E9WF54_ANGAN
MLYVRQASLPVSVTRVHPSWTLQRITHIACAGQCKLI